MIDLQITDGGELVLGPDGDLALVYGDDQIAQEVLFRLKTQIGDWTLSPQIGADLEDFIGQPNTGLVHAAMEQRIINALAFDSLVGYPEVTATSVSENKVMIIIEFPSVEERSKIVQITSQLDLREGLVFARVGTRSQ